MDIKGVMLESLGYLSARHAVNWLNFTAYNGYLTKTNKYIKNNAKDLSEMKVKALDFKNFSQLENFIEYEDHIANSYFTTFSIEFIRKIKQIIEKGISPYKEFFSGSNFEIIEQKYTQICEKRVNQTQDVR